jgi:Fe-S oxidoreductase
MTDWSRMARETARALDDACTRCGACRAKCAFLQEAGTPGEVARAVALGQGELPDPYHCSLCGLCAAVCPEGLRPEALFLDMRRAQVASGGFKAKPYGPILSFERLGDSALFSLLRLPEGGTTVLFPGCGLPASRPDTVRRLFDTLRGIVPDLGVALGCCLKPSHDLGRAAFFETRFGALHRRLLEAGVKRVLTACPNCHKVFTSHGRGLDVVSVYSLLADAGVSPVGTCDETVVIHDPCPLRHDSGVQDAVRSLVAASGVRIEELSDRRGRTLCCGEGGMVKFVRPEFAVRWTAMRARQAKGRPMVTSCAGCAGYLGGAGRSGHVLDMLLGTHPGKWLVPPLTYGARLLLKAWFARVVR